MLETILHPLEVQPKWIFLAWRRGPSCKPRQTSLTKPELRHGRQNSPQRVSAGKREGNAGCRGGPAASTVGGNRCRDSFLPEVCTRRSVACSLPCLPGLLLEDAELMPLRYSPFCVNPRHLARSRGTGAILDVRDLALNPALPLVGCVTLLVSLHL